MYTYVNSIQGPSELYADFTGTLEYAFEKKVKGTNSGVTIKAAGFNNMNEDCQGVIRPQKERGEMLWTF